MWLFFAFSLLSIIVIYVYARSDGLNEYASSFSTYLIRTTVENYETSVLGKAGAHIGAMMPVVIYFIIYILLSMDLSL